MKYPKVKIDDIELPENDYVNYGKRWNCLKLIEESKKYNVFNLPLAAVDLSNTPWVNSDLDSMLYHIKRINNTNLRYPIILDDKGYIADGWHRILKAILQGETTIKAIRLEKMPPYDEIISEE